jgi:drug/metabolite transporter (DMT)-like permease
MRWTHARAVWTMVAVTAMWSIAGVVTRHLDSAHSFEVTFWRSLFTMLSLLVILPIIQGRWVFSRLFFGPRVVWASGVCWAVMFTSFMMALTQARVAEVLVIMSIGPLLSALLARIFLKHRIAVVTWLAIAVAGAGMAWMFSDPADAAQHGAYLGVLIALLVPSSAAINWTLMQNAQQHGQSVDLVPAVWVGALLSAAWTLPMAWPLQASTHDVAWLSLLGLVQLAIPCVLLVMCARILSAPEISLLALLEVLFGTLLAWWGADEAPSPRVISGGALVLLALLVNVWWTERQNLQKD